MSFLSLPKKILEGFVLMELVKMRCYKSLIGGG
jgi:hypothetical protein